MSRGRTDLATPYMREALHFIGIRDISFVAIGPTSAPAEHTALARDRAHRRLVEMAARF